jgi:hypothetical protein
MIKDQTSARDTITLEKFAKRVASAVCKFLDVSMSQSFFIMVASGLTLRGVGRPAGSWE